MPGDAAMTDVFGSGGGVSSLLGFGSGASLKALVCNTDLLDVIHFPNITMVRGRRGGKGELLQQVAIVSMLELVTLWM